MTEPEPYLVTDHGVLYHGDYETILETVPDQSIDLILSDLPYNTTACKWDTDLNLTNLWSLYNRVLKPDGVVVLTASQSFTSKLVVSNPTQFRYEWIWQKEQGVNFLNAKRQPLKVHESVLVFSPKRPRYYPIMREGKPYTSGAGDSGEVTGRVKKKITHNKGTRYPISVLPIKREYGLHPTQKPVELFRYMIETYTREGETVLDNCIGSGTTAIACEVTGRRWIGIEKELEYCEVVKERIRERELEKRELEKESP